MTQVTTNPFTTSALSNRAEPAWLLEARAAALEVYVDRAVPTTAVEAWKYTNLRRFKPENFVPANAVSPISSLEALPEKIRDRLSSTDAAGRIVLSGNSVIYSDVPSELESKGVIFTDLKTALEKHPDLVQKYLYSVVGAAYPDPSALRSSAMSIFRIWTRINSRH